MEFLLGVYLVDGELVDPFPDLRFVVEDLTAEEPVLAQDKRRYLSGSTESTIERKVESHSRYSLSVRRLNESPAWSKALRSVSLNARNHPR